MVLDLPCVAQDNLNVHDVHIQRHPRHPRHTPHIQFTSRITQQILAVLALRKDVGVQQRPRVTDSKVKALGRQVILLQGGAPLCVFPFPEDALVLGRLNPGRRVARGTAFGRPEAGDDCGRCCGNAAPAHCGAKRMLPSCCMISPSLCARGMGTTRSASGLSGTSDDNATAVEWGSMCSGARLDTHGGKAGLTRGAGKSPVEPSAGYIV